MFVEDIECQVEGHFRGSRTRGVLHELHFVVKDIVAGRPDCSAAVSRCPMSAGVCLMRTSPTRMATPGRCSTCPGVETSPVWTKDSSRRVTLTVACRPPPEPLRPLPKDQLPRRPQDRRRIQIERTALRIRRGVKGLPPRNGGGVRLVIRGLDDTRWVLEQVVEPITLEQMWSRQLSSSVLKCGELTSTAPP